jgi:hypothetical protein
MATLSYCETNLVGLCMRLLNHKVKVMIKALDGVDAVVIVDCLCTRVVLL